MSADEQDADDTRAETAERELNELHDEVAAEARQWRAMLLDLSMRFAWDLLKLRKEHDLGFVHKWDDQEVAGSTWTVWAKATVNQNEVPDVLFGVQLDTDAVTVVTDRQNIVRAAKQSAAFQYNLAPEMLASLLDEDVAEVV